MYCQPSSDYNLISCSQLEDVGHDVMFRQRQMMRHLAIGLTRTGNIYAIQEADHDTHAHVIWQIKASKHYEFNRNAII